MMAAILNSAMLDSDTAILDSDILLSFLRFTQKYSHSNLTLTQTNSIWLKLIHSDSTWWCQPSWILPSWIQPFCTKKTLLVHSDSTWWWQPSWTLPCWIQTLPSWIQTSCYPLSDSLKNTLTPLWLWLKFNMTQTISIWFTWWWHPSWIQPFCTQLCLKLVQSDSNSLILT